MKPDIILHWISNRHFKVCRFPSEAKLLILEDTDEQLLASACNHNAGIPGLVLHP